MKWVLLLYRLPREPSTPRIALWRKLRRLGAVQLVDGVVALPAEPRTREQLEWLADEVIETGGEAWVWIAESASVAQQDALMERMAADVAEEYRQVAAEAEAAAEEGGARTLNRLRRELYRIRQRDYFPPPEREAATVAVARLAAEIATRRGAATR